MVPGPAADMISGANKLGSARNKSRLVDIEVQGFQNVVTAAYSGARALEGEGFE